MIDTVVFRVIEDCEAGRHLRGVEGEQVGKFMQEGEGQYIFVGGIEDIHFQDPLLRVVEGLPDRGKDVAAPVGDYGERRDEFALFKWDQPCKVVPNLIMPGAVIALVLVLVRHRLVKWTADGIIVHNVGDEILLVTSVFV